MISANDEIFSFDHEYQNPRENFIAVSINDRGIVHDLRLFETLYYLPYRCSVSIGNGSQGKKYL